MEVFKLGANLFLCSGTFFEPNTVEEVKEILELAKSNNKKLKISGYGHSPSNLACTDDYMISLKKLDRIIELDTNNRQIKVESGINMEKLNQILYDNNMAISVLGSISDQTIGGAISIGFHGTGINYGIINNYVLEIDMLLASGEVRTYSRASNSDEFLAVSCSLGCLGIILAVKLQCEPAFNLEQIEYPAKLEQVLESLDVYTKSSDHFRMLWYPHTDNVICYNATRTSKPVNPRKSNWIKDKFIGYYLLEFLYWIATYINFIIPYINQIYFKIFSDKTQFTDVSYRVFNFDCLFKQYAFEAAIPIKETAHYLLKLKAWLDNNPHVRVHFGVEIRFVKGDDIWLSNCYQQDSCYLNILMFRPYGKDYDRQDWWDINEKLMVECNGRPHWAKTHHLRREDLEKLYPKFADFNEIRKRLDPTGIFMNECLKQNFD